MAQYKVAAVPSFLGIWQETLGYSRQWVLWYSLCRESLRSIPRIDYAMDMHPLSSIQCQGSSGSDNKSIWLAFRRPTSGWISSPNCHTRHDSTTYLTYLVPCNQDVPGCQISVHKGFVRQVLHTRGYILAENKEGMGGVRWNHLPWPDIKQKIVDLHNLLTFFT